MCDSKNTIKFIAVIWIDVNHLLAGLQRLSNTVRVKHENQPVDPVGSSLSHGLREQACEVSAQAVAPLCAHNEMTATRRRTQHLKLGGHHQLRRGSRPTSRHAGEHVWAWWRLLPD